LSNIESQIKNLGNEEEPYVGMPISSLNRMPAHNARDPLAGMPLAMAYVPWQCWCETYKPAEGWCRGTIFPELDLPFLGGGEC
jgi:hypothetical protein